MIEIRIGRYRLLGISKLPDADLDHIHDGPDPGSAAGCSLLPSAISRWLDRGNVAWRLVSRRMTHSRRLVRLETILQIDDETDARAFEATWSGWLRERYLADLHADAEICRQRADAAFRWLLVASPELVGNAAYDLLLAERLHRRSVGSVVRFEAFVTAPGWYRVGVRHTEYFAVHYDVVPPNRNQHRDMRLGLNFVGDEREPLSLRIRPRDVRIGIWRRLYARGRLFSVERTLTATEQAFTDAGGYIAVYRPKADYAFLFERHIPDGVEFLPCEVTDWLNRHAPGWRFIDRRRHVGGNTVWQDTVVVFEGREDADAFRTRWAQFLNLCETAGLARAVDLAQEAISMATLEVRMSNLKKRVSTVEALLAAHRRMNRLLSRILRLQPSARV